MSTDTPPKQRICHGLRQAREAIGDIDDKGTHDEIIRAVLSFLETYYSE